MSVLHPLGAGTPGPSTVRQAGSRSRPVVAGLLTRAQPWHRFLPHQPRKDTILGSSSSSRPPPLSRAIPFPLGIHTAQRSTGPGLGLTPESGTFWCGNTTSNAATFELQLSRGLARRRQCANTLPYQSACFHLKQSQSSWHSPPRAFLINPALTPGLIPAFSAPTARGVLVAPGGAARGWEVPGSPLEVAHVCSGR